MAGTTTNGDFQNGAPFYLDPNQEDLLLAALASNHQDSNGLYSNMDNKPRTTNGGQFQYPVDGFDPSFFTSPQQSTPTAAFSGTIGVEDSPYDDYLDGDASFNFDNPDDDLMIGSLPGDSPENGDETSEKRNRPTDDGDDPDGGGKRREGEDKTAKKPGRKPLTSEPTSNRAAQRAFRERKEKHLKDLETKVTELEKASDASNHENGLLRAQVQRLQMELREYRKRLSLNSASISRAPPVTNSFGSVLTGSGTAANSFQFDFPRFGGLPGAHILDNGPLAKKSNSSTASAVAPNRQNSTGRSLSPRSQASGSIVNSPEKIPDIQSANAAQRSSSLNNSFGGYNYNNAAAARQPQRSSTDSSSQPSRIFQFNSSSSVNSDSPSASSVSQTGQNSSCDTSPEPSHNSPNNPADTIAEGYVCHGNSEGEITFCEKLNMACGNPRNPIPRTMSQSDTTPPPTVPAKSPNDQNAFLNNGIDFFANQNGGQFDPTLFGDYRESQTAIVGDGDFSGGFFNDAFPITDFGSPFHFGDTPAVQKSNPLEQLEKLQDGVDDEVVPGDDPNSLLNCHKIWDKLSKREDFKDGTIDIDNLCSELRAKARCSESGVVVDHKDVEAALGRLPPK
ncbi:PAP1-domain-containing protein [Amniculicola lignicola CBS 123094]|uniref:PAP1-domain-containing protein n=1 Tax=Amniculicola lignicola CBS 123094 TaxID=1392246 RepID=A0A6A5WM21_9PLEO|nr:PAP1-domain-containing protein [Amniculicola lignicola CBS 123094]